VHRWWLLKRQELAPAAPSVYSDSDSATDLDRGHTSSGARQWGLRRRRTCGWAKAVGPPATDREERQQQQAQGTGAAEARGHVWGSATENGDVAAATARTAVAGSGNVRGSATQAMRACVHKLYAPSRSSTTLGGAAGCAAHRGGRGGRG
jgi:hypothetical protein